MSDQDDTGSNPSLREVAIDVKGKTVTFPVADVPDGGIFFCMGVRKSGSTFLNHIMNYLAKVNGVNAVDIAGTMFKKGFVISDWADADLSEVIRPGNYYGGFRALPPAVEYNAAYRKAPKIFMFRDPRDALVSQYFSDAYSHAIPAKEDAVGEGRELFLQKRADALAADLNDYAVKQARSLNRTLERYYSLLDDPNCLLLRYEDYVFQKRRLVNKIIRHFNWTCTEGQIEHIMGNVDKMPTGEEKTSFIRRVIPGDHVTKLSRETIRKLNNILAEVMQRYDYY